MSEIRLPILQAAHANSILEAALAYADLGFSVLPLHGKRPAVPDWKIYQQKPADPSVIQAWQQAGVLQNVGIVCGAVSNNLVVLDLDGAGGYPAFAATFPQLAATYTVASGGGVGRHVYWQVDTLPTALKAMDTPIGNIEICAAGRQVVAPPSIHPATQQLYRVEKALPILHLPDLADLSGWVAAFKGASATRQWQPPVIATPKGDLNPQVIAALADHFQAQGFKLHGDWLHGRCVYPHRHKNGDAKASFGYNVVSGYGYCYRCGTLLSKDLCTAVGIDPAALGGLLDKTNTAASTSIVNLANAPIIELPKKTTSGAGEPPAGELRLDDLNLPRWLNEYLGWAGATGNQTPLSFHLFAGLWLAATAVGRRLYADAPWGQTIYPNLYLIVVAVSTFYRKSTAYRLAEQVAQQTFPHLLLPTPGSPERLLTSLAGALPPNFKDLSAGHQAQLQQARPFAAQRALRVDEIAGLLSAVNKRDYMVGMKDHLLEIYDCPPVLTRDTQTGLTIIERPTLSILGLTTPAALANAVGFRDWMDGLFPRFLLVSPESNYQERPALREKLPIPPYVLDGLHRLYSRLPVPPDPAAETPLDAALADPAPLAWQVQVECWQACMAYGEKLRQFCDPNRESDIEERLRPVYGRLHVQALKLALLLAVLRWIDEDTAAPTVTLADWQTAETLAEYLRASTHQLIGLLDRSGEASREQSLQDRMLAAFADGEGLGRSLREVYRQLHLPAKAARQMADDLMLAGLLVKTSLNGAEGYIARPSPTTSAV